MRFHAILGFLAALTAQPALADAPPRLQSLEQQIAAEEKAKADARQKAANAIPPNLADARASKDDEVLPDDSLDSILKSKR